LAGQLNLGGPDNVVEREFDALADSYESNRLSPWYRAHSQIILESCPPPLGGDVLDIGCATGYLLRSLVQSHPQVNAVGLDISGRMVELAGQKARAAGLAGLHFQQGNWEALEPSTLEMLRGYKFGLVVCANTFHYFTNPVKAAQDMFNILSPGGRLLVLERERSRSALTSLWALLHRYFIKDQVEFYTTASLLDLFGQAGFAQARVIKSIKKYFWKRKLFTSVALMECFKST